MKKNVFIIGLGRFGKSLATFLSKDDVNITVADIEEKIVKDFAIANDFASAIVLDSTNIDALSSTAIEKSDEVIVAMSKIEESILTCVNLKDLGVQNIIAKAQNKTHVRLLKAIGIKANSIVFPENDLALLTAQQILYSDINIIRQGKELTILSLILKNEELIGKKAEEFDNEYFKIFAIKPNQINSESIFILKDVSLNKLDRLFIICDNNKLKLIKKIFVEQ